MTDEKDLDDPEGALEEGCVFCRIVGGDFGTTFLAETDRAVAFADLSPQAPVHVLIVPRRHVVSLSATGPADDGLLGELLGIARDLARSSGIEDSGYRVLTNVGADAGQSVFHLHLHLLGGKGLGVGLTTA